MNSRWQSLKYEHDESGSLGKNEKKSSEFLKIGNIRCSLVFVAVSSFVLISLLLTDVIHFTGFSLDVEESQKKRIEPSGTKPYLPEKGTYKGNTWKNERTIEVTTLGETPFARCDVHSVMNEDGKTIIHDWLFLEEINAINVAVMTSTGNFIIFEQNKYAISGRTFSPVGGMINSDEVPFDAARREVMEELGMGSSISLQEMKTVGYDENSLDHEVMENSFRQILDKSKVMRGEVLIDGEVPGKEKDWVHLGTYRTAANRGGGFTYSYLLKNAVPLVRNGGLGSFKGSGDDEEQKILVFSQEELMKNLHNFKEIKWVATMSLSLLHLR